MKGQSLQLSLQLLLARHGWGGLCVLGGLLLLGLLSATLLPQQRQALAREQARLAEVRRTPAPIGAAPAQKKPSLEGLAAFEAILTPRSALSAFLVESWNSAATHSVRIAHAEYRQETDPKGGFTRLHMTVPAVGRYPAIKRYALDLLAHHPGLALQKLEIKREQSANPDVEADLHFVLLLAGAAQP